MSQATLGDRPYNNSDLFSGYFLDEHVQRLDPWADTTDAEAAYDELQALYEQEGELLSTYNEDNLLDKWIGGVLDILGYGTLQETPLPYAHGFIDRLLFQSDDDRRKAGRLAADGHTEAVYQHGVGILEAKQWDADFEERFTEQRPYRDASHQLKFYLERTPDTIDWGILTNGRKWRLYGTKDYQTQTYYEVDLPELLEADDVEEFKYFYTFFRPEAFNDVSGSSFVDTVWTESETASRELGDDLQDNVFTALRVAGQGFLQTNDLDLSPDDTDDLQTLKQQSLVLLYRLMFILYAEDRKLIHPSSTDAKRKYTENFSLDHKRTDILETVGNGDTFDAAYSQYSTQIWTRLQNLFSLIDKGNDDLGIPAYNGGLFDKEKHTFLAEHEIADRYIAEVIYRLSTTGADGEESMVLADYADLDTRHLGSIYEGLLEHRFNIAETDLVAVNEGGDQVWESADESGLDDTIEIVQEGDLYVVNDQGKRKTTGSYYTPDYVVSYIVEQTIDPLLADIHDELVSEGLEQGDWEYAQQFADRVRELKLLDPAMGSGHFLTKATGYLTEQVMAEVRKADTEILIQEEQVRRRIAKECIYGVDLIPMAVELSKLSMWLETLAADQPLAFLDHHLKTGNSLVGSDITDVLSDDSEGEDRGQQLTLTQAFKQVRQRTLEHVMELMQDLLAVDNETLEDVKSMEDIYARIRDDPLYQRLFELANVHTAEQFGVDVFDDDYDDMARAIENEDEWSMIRDNDWFSTAQTVAENQRFFHWELEFPEVFFDQNGDKVPDAGFDAVVGNPPYVRIYGDTLEESYVEYLRSEYATAHMKFDLYVVFTQLGIELTQQDGMFSYIIPDKFTSTPYGEPLRKQILSETKICSILDLRDESVFDGVTVSNLIPVLRKTKEAHHTLEIQSLTDSGDVTGGELPLDAVVSDEDSTFRLSRSVADMKLTEKVREQSIRFDDIYYTNWGLRTGTKEKTEKYVVTETDNQRAHPMIRGQDVVEPYRLRSPSEYIIYEEDNLYNPMFPELFENDKIVFRKISGQGLMAVADENDYYCFSTLIPCVNIQNVVDVDRAGIPDLTPESQLYENIYYALAIVNSSLLEWFYGVNLSDDLSVVPGHINELPIPEIEQIGDSADSAELESLIDEAKAVIADGADGQPVICTCSGHLADGNDWVIHDLLAELGEWMTEFHRKHEALNLSLLDYFGNYAEGVALSDIGLVQPHPQAAGSTLQQTAEERPNLRTGQATVHRIAADTLEIHLTARYKPEDENEYETDQWGYTESDPLPALKITDLTETEADLIAAFVPVVVEEAGGFANFRETVTKTNSLTDRLRALTLPAVEDVRDGLASYQETRTRADELEEKITRTDQLIDQIVYRLYDLSDDEIALVEDNVTE